MKGLIGFCLAAALVAAVPYNDIRAVERAIERRFQSYSPAEPIEAVTTLGMYVEGTGAVFNSEVILVQGPGLSPFRPQISKEDVAKIHDREKARLPELQKLMRESMVSAASALPGVPVQEDIVYGVTMVYQPWEDLSGLPRQIVMRARKQALLESEKGLALEKAVRVQEY